MSSLDRAALDAKVSAVFERVVAWRRHIHAHPDLSYQEQPTADYIAQELKALDPAGAHLTVTRPLPNAVVADLRGTRGDSATIIALRADIDALPVTELADVPYKSTKPGVMHACGHDTHTAMLMGAICVLLQDVSKINGTVRFLFQPAEEIPPGGAIELIKAGCLKGVAMAFGLHVMPLAHCPTGSVMIRPGTMLRSSDNFDIRVIGRGGHGSMPELSIDPVPIAGQIAVSLQQMVARRLPSTKAPVLTVTTIQSSSDSYNVIPDEVLLKGTLRCTDEHVREKTLHHMEEVVKGIAQSMGATCELKTAQGYHLCVNHDDAYEVGKQALAHVLDSDEIVHGESSLNASEDFSCYAREVPSNYVVVGTYNPEKGCTAPNHNPQFKVDEECFKTGIKVHYAMAYEVLMR